MRVGAFHARTNEAIQRHQQQQQQQGAPLCEISSKGSGEIHNKAHHAHITTRQQHQELHKRGESHRSMTARALSASPASSRSRTSPLRAFTWSTGSSSRDLRPSRVESSRSNTSNIRGWKNLLYASPVPRDKPTSTGGTGRGELYIVANDSKHAPSGTKTTDRKPSMTRFQACVEKTERELGPPVLSCTPH